MDSFETLCVWVLKTQLRTLTKLKEKWVYRVSYYRKRQVIGGRVIGIVTLRDIELREGDPQLSLKDVMTPIEDMIAARSGVTLQDANDFFKKSKKVKLQIINGFMELVALIARTNLKKGL